MLEPMRNLLEGKSIILASSSPRRKEILTNILNLKFDVEKSDFVEDLDKSNYLTPQEYVKATALCKAEDVLTRILKTKKVLPDIIIGADTVVFLNDEIIEKPKDFEDAVTILHKLNDKVHGVCTGVALMTLKFKENDINRQEPINQLYHISTFDETSWVEFDYLRHDVIQKYVETGEPMDKAGGYGIQSLGGSLIRSINGDYFNVMGFPVNLFARKLQEQLVHESRDCIVHELKTLDLLDSAQLPSDH